MEEQAEQNIMTMDLECRRMLNFNAPLLSTRRLANSVVAGTSLSMLQSTSIPFSWEQAPGKPKNQERSNNIHDRDVETPRLQLPPCLQHLPRAAAEADLGNAVLSFDQDDGCDGDDDDDDDNENKKNSEVYSDAMELFSLSEALDIVVQQSETNHSSSNDVLRLKLSESNVDQCSSYMINRFLPDATALAASSSAHFPNNGYNKKGCDTCSNSRHSYASSPKGCGLQLLFPWRMKHKLCAIKSPVMTCSTKVQKHQQSLKNKKHCSSVHKTSKSIKGDI
ncbi:hypothetical protein HN51_066619 [Arachis hypogaea]|uniref:Uncharacterized protein n=2 Tax=Arachis TaxID=3817 RepID=A0A445DF88_ARAHY|nr:uncharacterized protein LOC107485023 [Arachis duranensis]XP_016195900.1 uncharacterized protein LOC107636944 [Arachis ipaensis]XP_025647938.1 uncharacterized protein LOC112742910 [Arachis hypogaea]XP_025692835.1 uncharacterized protein LOC112795093 [Arachis hypogaea]RYR61830.1 hypothetical protein Ahy_A04g019060 [Arachis hypogaea]